MTATVSCLKLPKKGKKVKPGMVCSVAGWGRLDLNTTTNILHEVDLKIQKDELCTSRYKSPYNGTTQICVGDPKENRSPFSVSFPALSMPSPEHAPTSWGPGTVGTRHSPMSSTFPSIQSLVLSPGGRWEAISQLLMARGFLRRRGQGRDHQSLVEDLGPSEMARPALALTSHTAP